jgi:hypothetical protein
MSAARWLTASALVLGAAGVLSFTFLNTRSVSTAPAKMLPVVRAAAGQPVTEAQAMSTAKLGFPDEDISTSIMDEPVLFEYADPAHRFGLPPTRFVWLNQTAGRIHDVILTPQLEFTDWPATRVLAESVVRTVERAGWTPDPAHAIPFDDIARAFADPRSPDRDRWDSVRSWSAGGVTMELTLKRTHRAGYRDPRGVEFKKDSYLVQLDISDSELGDVLLDEALAARRAAGDPHTPLPLTRWVGREGARPASSRSTP